MLVDRGPIDGGCAVGSAGHLVPSHVIPLAAPGALWSAAGDLIRRDGALSVSWTTAPSFWRWIIGFARSCNRRSVESAAPALGDLARLSTEIWDRVAHEVGRRRGHRRPVRRVRRPIARSSGPPSMPSCCGDGGSTCASSTAPKRSTCEPALREPVAGGVLAPRRPLHPSGPRRRRSRSARRGVWCRAHPTHRSGRLHHGARPRRRPYARRAMYFRRRRSCSPPGRGRAAVARLLGQRLPMTAARGMSLTVDRPAVGTAAGHAAG